MFKHFIGYENRNSINTSHPYTMVQYCSAGAYSKMTIYKWDEKKNPTQT